jgi:catechol 2,3-dioxygenase-like lactoylglutathione lyase family enzyme
MIEPRDAGEPSPTPGTMDLLAFRATQPDVNAVLAFLAGQRIEVESSTGFTAYFRDPDGRRVALSTYSFPALRDSVTPR